MSGASRIAFAGGGSGGHIYPLISVADEVRKKNPQIEIFFVSTPGSIEEKIIPKSNYPLFLIPSGKLKGQSLFKKIGTLLVLPISFLRCLGMLLRKRPNYVFSAGGYAGAPYLISAALMGIPCGILEQNRIPGLANRMMAKFCNIIFINFAATKECFPGKKTIIVGHPYRKEIEEARVPELVIEEFFKKDPFYIFIFGGSQGAVGINRLIAEALPELTELNIFIHHQTGESDFTAVKMAYDRNLVIKAKIEPYVYDMSAAYKNAQLVICRAGASSIAELAVAQKAALLIPLVSKDKHQEFNAEELFRQGAVAFSRQQELNGHKLAAMIKEFYYDRSKLINLAKTIGQINNQDSAKKIADALIAQAFQN